MPIDYDNNKERELRVKTIRERIVRLEEECARLELATAEARATSYLVATEREAIKKTAK